MSAVVARKVMAPIEAGIEPDSMAVSSDGRTAVITSENPNMVHWIDAASLKAIDATPVGKRPRFAAFSPDGRTLWASSETGGDVAAIDAAPRKVVETIGFSVKGIAADPIQPVGISPTRDGRYAFVALGPSDRVAVIDARTFQVVDDILVGRRAWQLAMTADESRLFNTNAVWGARVGWRRVRLGPVRIELEPGTALMLNARIRGHAADRAMEALRTRDHGRVRRHRHVRRIGRPFGRHPLAPQHRRSAPTGGRRRGDRSVHGVRRQAGRRHHELLARPRRPPQRRSPHRPLPDGIDLGDGDSPDRNPLDGLSTACMVLGRARGERLVARWSGCTAQFVGKA